MSIPGYEPAAAVAPGNGAHPVLAATWSAHVLDTGAVHDELNRLWAQLGLAQATRRPEDDALIGGVLMRANTLNLLAVAHSTAEADRVQDAIVRLSDYHPARAIILVADPGRRSSKGGLDVRVALLEQQAEKGRPAVRFECVSVHGDRSSASHLASIASPLLVPELPDFLWWPGDSLSIRTLFDALTDTVDRLIVDSAAVQPVAGLQALAALVERARTVKTSDFAWARLTSWRELIAQFFDHPAAQPCLDCLDDVTITYAARERDGVSGLSSALLLVGWLASRLGWEMTAPLAHAGAGWTARLHSGRRGKPREIALRLRSAHGPETDHCLGSVALVAHGEAAGAFTVERTTPLALTTASETPTMPRVSRMVYARPRTDTELLGEELQIFGRDPIFEEALTYAARLLPQEAARP